jgi:hypothetical protein
VRFKVLKYNLAVIATVSVAVGTSLLGLKVLEAQGAAEKEVLQVQADRFRAAVAEDVNTLRRIMADELWYCRPSGYCEDKEHFLQFVGAQNLKGMKAMTMKVNLYGDTAMVTGQFEQINPGTTPANHFLSLEFWVKRDRGWQLAKFQATDPPKDVHRFNDCKEAGDVFNSRNRWLGYYLGGTKTGAEKDVLQVQMAHFRAEITSDSKSAANLFADELRYCPASGYCQNKVQHLRTVDGTPDAMPSGVKVLDVWPEHMKVDVYGNAATVVGRVNEINTIRPSTKLNTDNSQVLEIYIKRDGRWQLAGSGASDIPGWSPYRCRERG